MLECAALPGAGSRLGEQQTGLLHDKDTDPNTLQTPSGDWTLIPKLAHRNPHCSMSHTHTQRHTQIYTDTHIHTHRYTHRHTPRHKHTRTHTHTETHTHRDTHRHTYTDTHTQTHTDTHTQTHTHTQPPCGRSLCILPTAPRGGFWKRTVSICRNLAWLCEPGRNPTNLSNQHHPWDSKRKLSTQPRALQDGEKVCELKNSITRGNKMYGVGVSTEQPEKASDT